MDWAHLAAKAASAAVKGAITQVHVRGKLKQLTGENAVLASVMATYIGRGLDTTSGKLVITNGGVHYQATAMRGLFKTNEVNIALSEIDGVEVKDHGWPWKRRCRLEVTVGSKTHSFIVNDPDSLASMLTGQ